MLYAKQINTRATYCTLVDNKMCFPIIFFSKEPPTQTFLHKLIVINI